MSKKITLKFIEVNYTEKNAGFRYKVQLNKTLHNLLKDNYKDFKGINNYKSTEGFLLYHNQYENEYDSLLKLVEKYNLNIEFDNKFQKLINEK